MKLSEIARRAYDRVENNEDEFACNALGYVELGDTYGTQHERNTCASVARFESLFRDPIVRNSAWLGEMVRGKLPDITWSELRIFRLGMLNHFIRTLEENGE